MKHNLVGKILGKIKIFGQDFVPIKTGIKTVTKSSMAKYSHENLFEKNEFFVQDCVPIKTGITTLSESFDPKLVVPLFKPLIFSKVH